MRSNLITVVTAVASVVLVASVASADQVQEQFRLMEQRMAEMEDRLEATSDDLRTARATVDEQQSLLSDAGLVDASDQGLRSAVGSFFESVDISGVAAASYNHRLIKSNDPRGGNLSGEGQLFKNPNANTFQVDQIWMTVDKAPTEESRGGFHAEFATGTSSASQGSTNDNSGTPYLYSGYASYLAPVGNGVQVDLGRLGTVLGAEVVQTNGNFFITQGALFGLQPVTYNGATFTTQITDEIGIHFGVVNDVYSDTDISTDNDKAFVGQISYAGDAFGLNVGGIIGDADDGECGIAGAAGEVNGFINSANNAADVYFEQTGIDLDLDGDNDEETGLETVTAPASNCRVSLVDVVLTADPTDNLSLWFNYDWKHVNGDAGNGDTHGFAGAGRFALSDDMGISTRVEYLTREDDSPAGLGQDDLELLTVTGTLDRTLAEGLVGRFELRYDNILEGNGDRFGGVNGDRGGNDYKDDALVALVQMYYEF